ncbi:hypothetical protein BJ546DRAFT_1050740 [Cryomyces antarcticus]
MQARNPCSILPRRLQIVFSLAALVVFCVFFFGTPSSYDLPSVEKIQDTVQHIPKPKLPQLHAPNVYNPFRTATHEPPVQANSTSGETKWFSDWKWRNPFSSSITLDENRAVLPLLRKRPLIYTFYDTTTKKDEETKKAEQRLLLIWRRAWWAQGFKPMVLGRSEAMNHSLYQKLQQLELEPAMEVEIARWLAWGNMGTGVLANWLTLPMAPYEDALLQFLRRGEYPHLTRYEGLQSGLFCGEKTAVNEALKKALEAPDNKNGLSMIDATPQETFKVDPQHNSVAFYSLDTIISRYKAVAEALTASQAHGLEVTAQLINAHLQTTWQSTFSSGIAILKPLPEHTTHLVSPAVEIARNLSQCPESPIPSSCPPNRPKCKPCVSSHPMTLTTPQVFRNTSTLFTIGTVPHPYTLTSLHHTRDTLDVRFVRRETDRDVWLTTATKELLGTGLAGPSRLVAFKDAVASEWGTAHALWLTAERESRADLDWLFGFSVPRHAAVDGKSETPVPGPERRPPPPKPEMPVPSAPELAREKDLLDKARIALKNQARPMTMLKAAVEAWSLADAEAWRFARAFSARRRVERLKWEEEEKAFAGAEGRVAGTGWGRWFDRGRR